MGGLISDPGLICIFLSSGMRTVELRLIESRAGRRQPDGNDPVTSGGIQLPIDSPTRRSHGTRRRRWILPLILYNGHTGRRRWRGRCVCVGGGLMIV